ncbi:MAG: M56 family metallopeptidase [Clostridia bacterium]|nr:M56 family metallopeptidase [Clostridia bacterium]
MLISPFSVLMAIIWFSLISAGFCLLLRNTRFVARVDMRILILFSALAIVRLVLPFEFPNTPVLPSVHLMTSLLNAARTTVVSLFSFEFTIIDLILILWGAGSLISLCRLFHRHRVLRRQFRTLPQIDITALGIDDELLQDQLRSATCLVLPGLTTPAVYGFIRPVILIPEDRSNPITAPILLHELTHFRQGDMWIKLILDLIVCLFWWNPLAYFLRISAQHALELKCDADVRACMDESQQIQYYQSLLEYYKQSPGKQHYRLALHVIGVAGARKDWRIKQRFGLGLLPKNTNSKNRLNILCGFLLLFLLVASYSFIIQPAGPPPESGITAIDIESSYLLEKQDGTYDFYSNRVFVANIPEESIHSEPFSQMIIIKEGSQ